MDKLMDQITHTPLFSDIAPENLQAMLGCIGYHISSYPKGSTIAFEDDNIEHVGIVLSGAVDMIKEDLWGNKTTLLRMRERELFGETFACGSDNQSVVTFVSAEDTRVLFLPFRKVMHTCSMTCVFHHRLIENMVSLIAKKNRDLMRKIEVISKKSLREKILSYLSLQAQTTGSRYFEIPLGRSELADFLCADRSALSRELASMKAAGIIDYDRNMFRIL